MVQLMDAGGDLNKTTPLMSWHFVDAYPVSWEVSGLNAEESSIVVESLILAYSYFNFVSGKPTINPFGENE